MSACEKDRPNARKEAKMFLASLSLAAGETAITPETTARAFGCSTRQLAITLNHAAGIIERLLDER